MEDILAARLEDALRRAFTERLGLEMRSGTLILGTERIAETAPVDEGRLSHPLAQAGHADDAQPRIHHRAARM